MWEFEHSVVTAAKRRAVWNYWTDLRNHARVEESVDRIELDGPFATGTTGRTIGPGLRQEWRLTDVVDGTRFVITGETADGSGSLSFAWEFDDSPGGRRMTQRIRATGPDVENHMELLRQMERGARAGMDRLAEELDRLAGMGGSQ